MPNPQEPSLDARLKDVPVPDELAEQLRGIAACDDAELDWRLRAVALPEGLIERLQVAAMDAEIEAALCDVPVPDYVVPRARIVPLVRRRPWLGQMALAASLLLAVSLLYFGGIAGLLIAYRPVAVEPPDFIVIDRGPLQITGLRDSAEFVLSEFPGGEFSEGLAAGDGTDNPLQPTLVKFDPVEPGPAGELAAEMGTEWDPMANWLLARWGLYGAPRATNDPLPILLAAPEWRTAGIEPPLVRGFDREFALLRGTQPPVSLVSAPALATVDVPLSTARTSFTSARTAVAAGRLPDSASIRVEDFLAAVDYPWPPAEPERLAIRTAAGPSHFSPTPAGLLQIGVVAGPAARRSLARTHLTVALEITDSMAADGRLETLREALRRFIHRLSPDDCFSLLLFRANAAVVVDQASVAQRDEIRRAIERLSAAGEIDWAAAWQTAVSHAMDVEAAADLNRRLVVVADSRPHLPAAIRPRMIEMTAAAAARGLKIEILDGSGRTEPDATLGELAATGGGAMHSTPLFATRAADDLAWQWFETMTGDSSRAAHDVRLRVRFDPQAVAAYRRIGHDPDASGGWTAAALPAELHFGEQATSLFEIWLLPGGGDTVAEATLEWLDPRTGDTQRARPQRISRVQFATSFASSPLSLQAAQLAAETAGVLRQSCDCGPLSPAGYAYQPKPRDLGHVRRAARQINPRLFVQPDFRQLLEFIESADRLLPDRTLDTAKSGTRSLLGGHWQESKK